jgi:hypothetical protein
MLRFALLGLVWLAVSSASAQQAAPDAASPTSSVPAAQTSKAIVPMEEPQPGDHWSYDVRDEISGQVTATRDNIITEVTPTQISVRHSVQKTDKQGLNVYDRSWNVIDNRVWKFSPHDGMGIQAPLAVGKTWAVQLNAVNAANGGSIKRSVKSKVVSQETITTQAGTFETFKIETSVSARNANDPTRKSDVMQLTWYAPAIDHWVKRNLVIKADQHLRTNETIELTAYGRKQ